MDEDFRELELHREANDAYFGEGDDDDPSEEDRCPPSRIGVPNAERS